MKVKKIGLEGARPKFYYVDPPLAIFAKDARSRSKFFHFLAVFGENFVK